MKKDQNLINIKKLLLILTIFFFSGCTLVVKHQLDKKYGDPSVISRIEDAHSPIDYFRDVKPILDRRCSVCHACYDAPCQLKLTSFEGIDRGASKEKVYISERILADDPSRLFIDAKNTQEWRERNFYPVLNERKQDHEANLELSVMYQILALKKANPLPDVKQLPDTFDFSLDRKQQCPKIEEFQAFSKNYPLWGMPYGLPSITDKELNILKVWIESGAKVKKEPPLKIEISSEISKWERFFNGKTNKELLMSRYIYEHLFLATLYFPDYRNDVSFRIVRSYTPPGEEIDIIPSRRPYDDPGVKEFYYRLWPEKSTIANKTNMPYALDKHRMNRWKNLFLAKSYQVLSLPDYNPENSSNPFKVFSDIPAKSRYKFMLDEAEYIIMSFIKGPVCRGRIALNVIEDRFWVMFINPDLPQLKFEDDFLEAQSDNLRLPIERESNATIGSIWTTYSYQEKKYLRAKEEFFEQVFDSSQKVGLKTIWDGYGYNDNVGLTVFRQNDAATVVKGFVGNTPKTAWLIGYPLLERIYYLLVAGYDVFGNVGHQLNSRLFMDFLRIEGEYNFLSLLPSKSKIKERDFWYREAPSRVLEYLSWGDENLSLIPGFSYKSKNPKNEILNAIKGHLNKSLFKSNNIEFEKDEISKKFFKLMSKKGEWVKFIPELAYVRVRDRDKYFIYSLFHDLGYLNVATPFFESDRRVPKEDGVTVLKGIHGAYPNAFFDVDASQLKTFMKSIQAIKSENTYAAFVDKFGIRRTDQRFWSYSDWLHSELEKEYGGILDYNRYENR